MAAASTIIAVAGLTLAAGTGLASYTQSRAAQRNQQRSEQEAEKAQREQSAANASQAAAERRQQIRQERVRRGAIVNAASLTGTSGSSGESGALGSLASQQADNMGRSEGGYLRGQRIGTHMQRAQDFTGVARRQQQQSGTYSSLSGLGFATFNAAGGWNNFFKE